MRDSKLRDFARELALGVAQGLTEAKAAYQASEKAGYPQSASWKPNARKRAQRHDVRKWMLEHLRPQEARAQELIEATKEQTCRRLTEIMMMKPTAGVKFSDCVAAGMGLARINGWTQEDRAVPLFPSAPIEIRLVKAQADKADQAV